ncbi:ImmA/IrrE family metallo-endopeptidase [uncultured Clostridium sp.]|uniref:ImmA/IrrE family metallo-endopeptidase n=1 Tax=uncultured Clostridium sp. TaxID=59620 RepID=UPI0025F1F78D|nr:ImmA/IrrE family metallo-endopeptidase [uncultured Clostridium sp.]
MNSKDVTKSLTDIEINDIVIKVNGKLGELKKNNCIIRDEIFRILDKYCKVIYYPIENDEICGFVYSFKGKKFAYINSYIPLEKQVFASAHELYHIWYSDIEKGELLYTDILDGNSHEKTIGNEDLKANRFAAELLVQEDVFRNEIKQMEVKNNFISKRNIVELMDIFLVSYKTIINRLLELKYIDKKRYNELIQEPDRCEEKGIILLQKRLGLCKRNNERTNEIKLDKLTDVSIKLYEKNQITYEKLEYLLGLSNTKPSDLGIYRKKINIIEESEIDKIMEE